MKVFQVTPQTTSFTPPPVILDFVGFKLQACVRTESACRLGARASPFAQDSRIQRTRAAGPHGDLPGGMLEDISAIKGEDAGAGLQLALGA